MPGYYFSQHPDGKLLQEQNAASDGTQDYLLKVQKYLQENIFTVPK